MDRSALRQALGELLEDQTDVPAADLGDDQDLREGLGVDSVDMINLVLAVENRFDVRIESEELRPIRRVGQLLDLLQAKLAAKPGSAAA